MPIFTSIAALVIAMAAIVAFGKQLQGLIISICIMLALIFAIQMVGCESFAEKREKRIEDRRKRWENRREDKDIEPEPIVDDEEKQRRRRFKFLRDGYYDFD